MSNDFSLSFHTGLHGQFQFRINHRYEHGELGGQHREESRPSLGKDEASIAANIGCDRLVRRRHAIFGRMAA